MVVSHDRVQWLDVARAVAILGVISVHAAQHAGGLMSAWNMPIWLDAEYYLFLGRYGVELFFFLSGWLLSQLYGRSFRLQSYVVRRTARIWPLWMLFIAIGFLQWIALDSGPFHAAVVGTSLSPVVILLMGATFTGWVNSGTWNTVIAGGWSIQAEVGHYVFFPFYQRLKVQARAWVFLGIVTAGVIVHLLARTQEGTPIQRIAYLLNQYALLSTLIFFLLGTVCQELWQVAIGIRNFNDQDAGDDSKEVIGTGSLLAIGFGILLVPAVHLPFGFPIEAMGFILLTIPFAYLISRTSLSTMFEWVGQRSYFIYFAHFFALDALSSLLSAANLADGRPSQPIYVFTFLVLFGSAFSASAILSEFSWRHFEKPILKAAHRFERLKITLSDSKES